MKSGHRSLCLLSLLLIALTWAAPAAAQTISTGQTAGGAHYRFIVPDSWNGSLVIWNHGFSLSPIGPVTEEDTELVEALAIRSGYAVAASSYQQPGWALFKSNQDLEQMVRVFETEFAVPDEVLLIGASLGGIVTAAALEKADLGNVTGALVFCGAMAGSRNWDGALDLRLVYDLVCDQKKSRIPGGAKGLEKGSTLTPTDIAKKVNACFGLNKDKPKRKQKRRLAEFLGVIDIPPEFVHINMAYVTFGMADLVYDKKKMKGKPGAGNQNVNYGNADVDANIARFEPRKSKARKLRKFYTPNGKVGNAKIISLHTDKDGLVIVENESEWAKVVPSDQLTVGIVVEAQASHCDFNPAEILGSWEALLLWIDSGVQPTAEGLQESCVVWETLAGGGGPCRIDPDFVIPDMDGRIRPR